MEPRVATGAVFLLGDINVHPRQAVKAGPVRWQNFKIPQVAGCLHDQQTAYHQNTNGAGWAWSELWLLTMEPSIFTIMDYHLQSNAIPPADKRPSCCLGLLNWRVMLESHKPFTSLNKILGKKMEVWDIIESWMIWQETLLQTWEIFIFNFRRKEKPFQGKHLVNEA